MQEVLNDKKKAEISKQITEQIGAQDQSMSADNSEKDLSPGSPVKLKLTKEGKSQSLKAKTGESDFVKRTKSQISTSQ